MGKASDGRQGVEQAAALCHDVVLMDVGMPGMGGIAATHVVKATTPGLRVVMLTSHTDDTEAIADLSNGVYAYCIKGTDGDALANAIQVAEEKPWTVPASVSRRCLGCRGCGPRRNAYEFSSQQSMAAQGGYLWLGYTAEDVSWQPSLSYRFAGFSGDNPNFPTGAWFRCSRARAYPYRWIITTASPLS